MSMALQAAWLRRTTSPRGAKGASRGRMQPGTSGRSTAADSAGACAGRSSSSHHAPARGRRLALALLASGLARFELSTPKFVDVSRQPRPRPARTLLDPARMLERDEGFALRPRSPAPFNGDSRAGVHRRKRHRNAPFLHRAARSIARPRPGTTKRDFEREAPQLGAQALRNAMEKADIADVDALFVCTCTGYLCPGSAVHRGVHGAATETFLMDVTGAGVARRFPRCAPLRITWRRTSIASPGSGGGLLRCLLRG